ncbi:MAG: WhiB family transcriptional regulator [Acidimicrobiales bacterium]|nr:WhiB family transcriptional regulator [Acidimicrobiales bacterium]
MTMTTFEYPVEEWKALASCASVPGTVGNIFFSEEIHEISKAKSICARCPVISPCLEGAIEREEPCGVWGGQLFMNGKVLMIKRRRGRPSKILRPEEQMPQIPVPEHLQELLKTA